MRKEDLHRYLDIEAPLAPGSPNIPFSSGHILSFGFRNAESRPAQLQVPLSHNKNLQYKALFEIAGEIAQDTDGGIDTIIALLLLFGFSANAAPMVLMYVSLSSPHPACGPPFPQGGRYGAVLLRIFQLFGLVGGSQGIDDLIDGAVHDVLNFI